LKRTSEPVAKVDDALRRLAADMLETMYAAPGIGLAAPQVGELKRLLVVDAAPKAGPRAPHVLINPEILWLSEEDATANEGCLSLPEHYADVVRPRAIKVAHLDLQGERRILEAEGLLATCIQHEIDHLDGVLFVDHISALKRSMILRKLLKAKKQGAFETV
jgi:peptide deformylase